MHLPFDDRDVHAIDVVLRELLLQHLARLEVLREHHHPRCLAIEAMDDVNAPAALLPHVFAQQGLRSVFGLALGGDGEQPIRLDDDEHVVVLVQQRQGRRKHHRLRPREHVDARSGPELALGVDLRLPVHADASGLQHLTESRPRRVGKQLREGVDQGTRISDSLLQWRKDDIVLAACSPHPL